MESVGFARLDKNSGIAHIRWVGRLVNVILLGLVLGALIFGAFALGNAVRRTGNEGARGSSGATQTQTETPARSSAAPARSNGHSTRRLKVLTAEVIGGLLVGYAILAAIGSIRRSRRREHWRA